MRGCARARDRTPTLPTGPARNDRAEELYTNALKRRAALLRAGGRESTWSTWREADTEDSVSCPGVEILQRKRYLLRSVSDLLKFSHMIVDTDLEAADASKSSAPTREPLCTAQARQPLSQPASAGSQMPVTKWLQLSNAEVGKVRALAPALRL